jgi:hypothetical protein
MTQYRLLARAEMHGAIREPGYVFTLAEGEIGPHRTVVASDHGAQITDHMNATQDMVDVPLYEEIKEPEPVVETEAEAISDEHAKDRARIADLERELADKDKQIGEAHARLASIDEALKAAPYVVTGAVAGETKLGAPLLIDLPESNLPVKG